MMGPQTHRSLPDPQESALHPPERASDLTPRRSWMVSTVDLPGRADPTRATGRDGRRDVDFAVAPRGGDQAELQPSRE